MGVRIINADVIEGLRQLDDESVNCVVTSPPYWGLRDYGVAGQIGMEPTLGEHLEIMVAVFREVRRVLRKDGTLWLNYGDCYATAPNGRSAADTKAAGNDDRTFRDKPFSTVGPIYVPDAENGDRRGKSGNKGSAGQEYHTGRIVSGGVLKPKDLCMIPNRLAIALQEDGWWVRSEIIWAKPNPMPESVTDRPATSHEKLWMLTKAARYFYDAEAVREPITVSSAARLAQDIENQAGSVRANGGTKSNGPMKAVIRGRSTHGRHTLGDAMPERERRGKGNAKGFRGGSYVNGEPGPRTAVGNEPATTDTRNCRNVWTIGTRPFAEAHFATFPPDLAERCIKAGCPADGVILDPFGGAGTSAMVADRLDRDAILIELNPDYCAMAERRIAKDRLERGVGTMADVAKADLPATPLEELLREAAE